MESFPALRVNPVRVRWTALLLGLCALAIQTARAGSLSSIAPAGVTPGQAVNITGTGFDPTAANNIVTFTPDNGSAVTASGSAIALLDAGSGLRRLTVVAPVLPVGTVNVRVTNKTTGENSDTRPLDILSLTLPDITSSSPGLTGVVVRVTGSPNTQFVAGNTRATFGTGITVRSTTVDSATSLRATIDVATSATLGPRDVAVISTTQRAVLSAGFSIVSAAPTNQAPTVSAGTSQTITLPSGVSLSGTASDDGLPNHTLTTTWSKVSGPGTVTFANASSLSTTATFDQAGSYVLRLTASDSALTAFSDVTITVNPAPPTNQAPTVSAGTNQTITLPSGVSLTGTASDDGLPSNTLTTIWTKFSGPGAVTFANASSLATTATFDQGGSYVLRLTASDGALSTSRDITITVQQGDATIRVNGFSGVYDGNAHGASGTATGINGEDLSPLLHVGATFVDVPGGTAHWTFDGTAIYKPAAGDVTIAIAQADAKVTVSSYSGTYDGNPHGVSGSAIGVKGENLASLLHLGSTFLDVPGGPVSWTFDGNADYKPASGSAAVTIAQADATIAVTGYTGTFDGSPHAATGTATGVKGENLASLLQFGSSFVNPPGGTAHWTFAGNTNYKAAAGDVAIVINPVVLTNATIVVNGYTGVYDGNPHGATGSAVGAHGEDLSALLHLGATFVSAPGGTAHWTFDGNTAYNAANGDVSIAIAPADATIRVTGYTGVYDGNAHGASGIASGVKAESLTQMLRLGSTFADAPGGTAEWTFTGNSNYRPASGSVAIAIAQADAIIHVNGYSGVFDGAPHGATGTATGVKGENLATLLQLGATFVSVPGGTAHWTFAGNANYKAASGDVPIVIGAVQPANHPPVPRPGGPYSGVSGIPVAFDGSASSDPDNDGLSYAWSFGDGTSAVGPTPTHAYAAGDRFTVTLTVTDSRGLSASATATADITQANRPPTASAGGPYSGDAGSLVAFSSAASDPDHDVLTLAWDFGDGSTGSGPAPLHAYGAAGSFAVTLTVTDTKGAATVATTTAVIGPAVDRAPPTVRLTAPKTALPGTQVTVTAAASDNVGVTSVTFEVDGAPTTQVAAPPFERTIDIGSVAAPGSTIGVKATAHDAANNAGVDRATITIVAAPDTTPPVVALQLPPQAAPGTLVLISAAASDDVGVRSVTFSTAGRVIATATAPPFQTAFPVPADAAPGSTLTFAARAFDYAGNSADSTASLSIVAAPDTTAPTVTVVAPATVAEGGSLHLTATAHDDVQVASVDFVVDDVVVGSAVSAPYAVDAHVGRPAGSVLQVRAVAKDSSNNQASSNAVTRVVSATASGAIAGRVYDDTTGLPLAGVSIALVGTDVQGNAYSAATTTDSRGQYFLDAGAGDGVVQVTRAGWTRVDRAVIVPDSVAADVFDARLTPLDDRAQHVASIIGASLQSGDVALTLAPAALGSDADLRVTSIRAQGIEGMLPAGWSPIAAVDIAPHGVAFSSAQPLAIVNRLALPTGAPLALAQWDESAEAWRTVATTTVAAGMSSLAGTISSTGEYAWVLADRTPSAPPAANAGDLLAGVTRSEVPDPAAVAITPKPKIVFYQPGVNASVTGVVNAALSSGTLLRAQLTEAYQFKSTPASGPDPFIEDFVFYQTPAPTATVAATFTVTPSLTFDPPDLQQGTITVELRAPDLVSARALVGPDGGTASGATGESLDVPAGALATPTPVRVDHLDADGMGLPLPPGLAFVGAASVGLAGATLNGAALLSIPRPVQLDDASPIVVLRLGTIQNVTRWLLVGMGRVNGTRVVMDRAVSGAATLLEGVTVAGRYVFAQGSAGLGFVTGTVFAASGSPLPGALVTTGELPVAALSNANGQYVEAAAVGAVTVTARDLQRLDSVTAAATIGAVGSVVALDLRVSTLLLTVTALTPGDGASSVALAASIAATFSSPVDPASLTGASAGNFTVSTATGSPIAGSVTLSAGNTKATFRPSALLAANTAYTVTISPAVTDVVGRPLGAPVIGHFTSLDTTPPPAPAAGSLSATFPDASGFTTISGAQGTAGPHDTVNIVNVTQKTSCPALVNGDGSFSAACAASLSDKLTVTITGPSGSQTAVSLPAFSRTNADGSRTTVVGSAGGHVDGPNGLGVDVPADALPDGTPVTVGFVDEASLPVQLTAEQRQLFAVSTGLRLDFGGATPAHYVDVSWPAAADDTEDDTWIVGQVMTVGGVPTLVVADTAHLVDGRVTTASPPCPGVAASAVYAALKSVAHPVGTIYGRLYNPDSVDNTELAWQMNLQPALQGLNGSPVLPYSILSTPSPVDVCMPALSGRVTVQPNSQNIQIAANQFTPLDNEIWIRNTTSGRDFYFPRNITEFRFQVDGKSSDKFAVTVTTPTGVDFFNQKYKVQAGSVAGLVNVVLDITTMNVSVQTVKIKNLRTGVLSSFPQSAAATTLAVDGSAQDTYEEYAIDVKGKPRAITGTVVSGTTGNFVARALPATIDPYTKVELDIYQTDLSNPNDPKVVLIDTRLIRDFNDQTKGCDTAACQLNDTGGFTFRFSAFPDNTFDVKVSYPACPAPIELLPCDRVPDVIAIPSVRFTISLPATGQVISTVNVLVPPPNEPLNLGHINGDKTPPKLITSPPNLLTFDPTGLLTFTFSEPINPTSVLGGALKVFDANNIEVAGDVRLTNKDKTLTFVPLAPLHLAAKYYVQLNGIADGSGNRMANQSVPVVTLAPVQASPGSTSVPQLRNGGPAPLEWLSIVKKPNGVGGVKTIGFGITGATGADGYNFTIFDLTYPSFPVVLSSVLLGDGGRVTTMLGVQNLQIFAGGTNPCGGGSTFSGDLAAVTTYTVGLGSAIRFFDVTNPAAPCQVGSKLLTINPANVGVVGDVGNTGGTGGGNVIGGGLGTIRADGAVQTSVGYARGVVLLPNGPRLTAYVAVENVGLLSIDVGNAIGRTVEQESREPLAEGNYTDVVATAGGQLLAVERSSARLDVYDPSLALISQVYLPLKEAFSVTYAMGVPFVFQAASNVPAEVRVLDVAFVGGTGGVAIVDVTDVTNVQIAAGYIPMAAAIYQLDFDAAERRLFAGGPAVPPDQDWAVFMFDLSGANPFGAVDANGDGIDDRLTWRSPVGLYGQNISNFRAIRFDRDNRVLYVGAAQTGYTTYDFDPPNLTGTADYTLFKPVTSSPPLLPQGGIDFTNPTSMPIRGAVVELRDGSGVVLQSTLTTDEGTFAFTAPVGASVEIVVTAALGLPGNQTTIVVDNTNSNRVYTKSSGVFVMPPTPKAQIIIAESLWDFSSNSYLKREAAPFALLDDAYLAQQRLLAVDPGLKFPLLTMAWSSVNRPSLSSTGTNAATGEIGTSFFNRPNATLYLLGAVGADTDEYDRDIVLHEWTHYFQYAILGRGEGPGGDHARGDILDPSVAFKEGLANAFAGIFLNDPVYIDTTWPTATTQRGGSVNLESDLSASSGYFSEDAVEELVWDLYDPASTTNETNLEGSPIADTVALGLRPIYQALVTGVKNTPAYASIFAFLTTLAAQNPADKAGIVALAKAENVDLDHADEFEQSTQQIIIRADGLQITTGRLYNVVTVNGTEKTTFDPGTPLAGQPLHRANTYDPNGDANKLDERVYFKFDIPAAGTYLITATPLDGEALYLSVNRRGTETITPPQPLTGVNLPNPGDPQAQALYFDPGTYTAAVFARAAEKRFTIRIEPQ